MPKRAGPIKWRREVEWVYRNLGKACPEHVEGKGADGKWYCRDCVHLLRRPPSKGAMALWKQAKADVHWFMEMFVAKMATPRAEEEKVKGVEYEIGDCVKRLEEWSRTWEGRPETGLAEPVVGRTEGPGQEP